MYLMRRLLDNMTQNYAITFRPLQLGEVKRLSIALKKNKMCVIPSDYANFLCWTDGLVWQDLELFSVYEYERPDTVYFQPTLLGIQQKKLLGDAFPHKLVLGRALEVLICYDEQTKLYEILDRFTFQAIVKFSRFIDVLYFYAGKEHSVTSPTETAS